MLKAQQLDITPEQLEALLSRIEQTQIDALLTEAKADLH